MNPEVESALALCLLMAVLTSQCERHGPKFLSYVYAICGLAWGLIALGRAFL